MITQMFIDCTDSDNTTMSRTYVCYECSSINYNKKGWNLIPCTVVVVVVVAVVRECEAAEH